MKRKGLVRIVGLVVVLAAIAAGFGVLTGTGNGAAVGNSVVLLYNGPAIANTHAQPTTAAFTAWCGGTCTPSVALPVSDAVNHAVRGTIYVWTTPYEYGSNGSICFGEFIWYALNDGNVYTDSGTHGTCGAPIDSALKPTTHLNGPGTELAGGGDGKIDAGGTGAYKNWTGTYTDRVFVEFNADFVHNYYDQLFFSITRG
ncbi:MAG TPA: hypothetical protein VGH79_06995 [Gaiellaceae bacterium]|jgi:hypothetical protein